MPPGSRIRPWWGMPRADITWVVLLRYSLSQSNIRKDISCKYKYCKIPGRVRRVGIIHSILLFFIRYFVRLYALLPAALVTSPSEYYLLSYLILIILWRDPKVHLGGGWEKGRAFLNASSTPPGITETQRWPSSLWRRQTSFCFFMTTSKRIKMLPSRLQDASSTPFRRRKMHSKSLLHADPASTSSFDSFFIMRTTFYEPWKYTHLYKPLVFYCVPWLLTGHLLTEVHMQIFFQVCPMFSSRMNRTLIEIPSNSKIITSSDASEMLSERFQDAFKPHQNHLEISRKWTGCSKTLPRYPKTSSRRFQDAPRSSQNTPKTPPRRVETSPRHLDIA